MHGSLALSLSLSLVSGERESGERESIWRERERERKREGAREPEPEPEPEPERERASERGRWRGERGRANFQAAMTGRAACLAMTSRAMPPPLPLPDAARLVLTTIRRHSACKLPTNKR